MRIAQYLSVTLFIILLAGCDRSGELEQQNTSLQAKNNELTQALSDRDGYINEVTESINNIYADLEGVRAKEKLVLKETDVMESSRSKPTSKDIRERLLKQISTIDSSLRDNRTRIEKLQARVSSYKTQFTGLRNMVNTLKRTVEEREQAMAQLESRVQSLETTLTEKERLISEQDSTIQTQLGTIDQQQRVLTTAYYVIGTRDDLEQKGIITKEGGFLWGLLGSTTTLADGFDRHFFTPINKTQAATIDVPGGIEEIVPKRNEQLYTKVDNGNEQSTLRITSPERFWQTDYLVIITD